MIDRHEPHPHYVSRLKWQLESEIRRRRSFPSEWRPGRTGGFLRVAALVVLSLFLGAAGVLAAQKYGDSWRAQLWRARTETALELAQARLEILQEETARLRQEGASLETLVMVEEQVDQARFEREEAELNLQEVRATRTGPRNELIAPLANDRDFVSEREELRVTRLNQRRQRLESYWAEVSSEPGRLEAEGPLVRAEIQQIERQLEALRRRLELRQGYLQGRFDAREVELRERLTGLTAEVAHVQAQLEWTEMQLEAVREAVAQDQASEFDLRRAAYDLSTVRAQARLLRTELELVRKQLKE